MSELTQIDGSFQNIAMGGDKRNWDAGANRWTKGDNDRLYFNDCKYVDYVDLESLFVHTDAPNTTATAEIDGDTLTVEIAFEDDIANKHKEMSATFELPAELAEEVEDEEDAEDEPEVVCDGGEDVTAHVDDETIEAAIESNDDPDHPDALTVEGVRELLAWVQRGAEEGWDIWMDHVEDGHCEVVYEDSDSIVLSTGEHNSVGEELERYEGDVEVDSVAHSVVTQIHHELARERCDFNWSTTYPYVIRKLDGFGAGERYVEAVINGLINEGLSPGQAWAVYGVHYAGKSRNHWASRCGYSDHSAISEPLRKAEEKAGHLGVFH